MGTTHALSAEQIAKLTKLLRHATRYEWVLRHVDGRSVLLCYAPPSQRRVRDYIRGLAKAHLDALHTLTANGFALDGYDRTQREAIIHGELPWFGHSVQ